MKPTLADLRAQCPDIPKPALNEYLVRLDENYFAVFSLAQMQAHLRALERRVLGADSTAERLVTELHACQQRVRRTYTRYFLAGTQATVAKDSLPRDGKVKYCKPIKGPSGANKLPP